MELRRDGPGVHHAPGETLLLRSLIRDPLDGAKTVVDRCRAALGEDSCHAGKEHSFEKEARLARHVLPDRRRAEGRLQLREAGESIRKPVQTIADQSPDPANCHETMPASGCNGCSDAAFDRTA